MVELLQGSISRGVMEVVTRKGIGLFPAPKDISLSCSCPDWATMCKHVAAVLYGVGARLDHDPEMLFTLRDVEPAELIAAAVTDDPTTMKSGRRRILKTDDMSSVFGIELDLGAAWEGAKAPRRTRRLKKTPTKKATKTRAAAARKKPASRARATKKSASAKSTSRKKPSSKRTKAAATNKDSGREIGHGRGQREDEGGQARCRHEAKEDTVIERERPDRPARGLDLPSGHRYNRPTRPFRVGYGAESRHQDRIVRGRCPHR